MKPVIRITGFRKQLTKEEIEISLKKQNCYINEHDQLSVTFIKDHPQNHTKTVYAECSSELFHKLMYNKRVYIGWERYPVYEDISIPRCFNCQGFFHKSSQCKSRKVCPRCTEEHDIKDCQNLNTKKCQNCVTKLK